MNNSKNYNKSIYIDFQQVSKRNINRRHSYDIKNNKIKDGLSTLKNKLKKINKNLFKNIPKNENLINFSSIMHNNENKKNHKKNKDNKDNKHYLNLLNNIYSNDEHFDNTNIKQKLFENNLRLSSLIPVSKKRYSKSKLKTIEDKNNLLFNILKKEEKRHSQKRLSINDDIYSKNSKNTKNTKNTKSSKKIYTKKYNSSKDLLKSNNLNKINEIENFKHILKDEVKNKKIHKKKENENEEKSIDKKECNNNICDKKSNIKEKRESVDKEKEIMEVGNVKTKNEYELLKSKKKEKKIKYKRFPLCCIPIRDDNSSDIE